MLSRNSIVSWFLGISLLFYSLVIFIPMSMLGEPVLNIRGDFFSTFPTFWAWKINPEMIKSAPGVRSWMGEEKILLDKIGCGPLAGIRPPPLCRHSKTEIGLVKNQNWNYGPATHFLLSPLLFLPSWKSAITVWRVLVVLFFIGSFLIWYLLLFRERSLNSPLYFGIYSFIWLNYGPTITIFRQLEVEMLMLFLFSLCFFFHTRKHSNTSGILLALSGMTKFLPLGFLPYFALKSRTKVFIPALISVIFLAILTQFTLGWEWSYTLGMMGPMGTGFTYSNTQSLSSWVYRFFTNIDVYQANTSTLNAPPVTNPQLALQTNRMLHLLVIGFYSLLFWKNRKLEPCDLDIAILCVLMIALPQWSNSHYLIFLLIPYSILLSRYLLSYRETSRLKIGTYTLTVFSLFLTSYMRIIPERAWDLIFGNWRTESFFYIYGYYSYPVYGYLILLTLLTLETLKKRGRSLSVAN